MAGPHLTFGGPCPQGHLDTLKADFGIVLRAKWQDTIMFPSQPVTLPQGLAGFQLEGGGGQ